MSRGQSTVLATGLAATAIAILLPASASALKVRTASDSTANAHGLLKATAQCKPNEHVVSGGFRAPDQGYAFVSRAKGPSAWTVVAENVDLSLTAFAYCTNRLENSVRSESKRVSPPAGTRVNAKATCPRRKAAVSGGYAIIDPDAKAHDLVVFNLRRKGKRSWGVSAFNDVDTQTTLKVFAYCVRGVDVEVRSARSEPVPRDTAGSGTARCRDGEELLSGGFKTSPKPDYQNDLGPDFFYFDSWRPGTRSWKASGINYSDVAGRITAFAYCR